MEFDIHMTTWTENIKMNDHCSMAALNKLNRGIMEFSIVQLNFFPLDEIFFISLNFFYYSWQHFLGSEIHLLMVKANWCEYWYVISFLFLEKTNQSTKFGVPKDLFEGLGLDIIDSMCILNFRCIFVYTFESIENSIFPERQGFQTFPLRSSLSLLKRFPLNFSQ